MSKTEKFEEWALVELFGHQRIAGKVSEQEIGGCSFVRVDVPETKSAKAHTRFFGNGAIYSINPTTEEIARHLADRYDVIPVMSYELPDYVNHPQIRDDSDSEECF